MNSNDAQTRPSVVATIAALLTFAASASAQARLRPERQRAVRSRRARAPAAKKAGCKTTTACRFHRLIVSVQAPAASYDKPAPEAVSRDAAKASSDAAGSTKPSAAKDNLSRKQSPDAAKLPPDRGQSQEFRRDDNPFPEAVSRDAAKAAGNDQNPPLPRAICLPASAPASRAALSATRTSKVVDPARAKKDADVGGFYLKKGDYQGALLRYQDAMAVDPTNVDAIFGLAETQQMLKKNADAARNYQLYLDIVPNGPKAKQAMKALKTLRAAE